MTGLPPPAPLLDAAAAWQQPTAGRWTRHRTPSSLDPAVLEHMAASALQATERNAQAVATLSVTVTGLAATLATIIERDDHQIEAGRDHEARLRMVEQRENGTRRMAAIIGAVGAAFGIMTPPVTALIIVMFT